MVGESMVKNLSIRTFEKWEAAHLVAEQETFAVCGIAPAQFWDDIRDYGKPICGHCKKKQESRHEIYTSLGL